MQAVLLDTCAAVWIAENEKLAPQAFEALDDVHQAGLPTYISPVRSAQAAPRRRYLSFTVAISSNI